MELVKAGSALPYTLLCPEDGVMVNGRGLIVKLPFTLKLPPLLGVQLTVNAWFVTAGVVAMVVRVSVEMESPAPLPVAGSGLKTALTPVGKPVMVLKAQLTLLLPFPVAVTVTV